jgi:Fur family ferric uptake transcriptional regulator
MSKNERQRMTRQRQIILEELRSTRSHPTADEVYAMVRQRLPRISMGTVYRNLELLEENGVIHRLETSGGPMRFDGDTADHYHIRCLGCHKVADIPIKPFAQLEQGCEHATDYQVVGHRLEFVGLCPQCREKQTSKSDDETCS